MAGRPRKTEPGPPAGARTATPLRAPRVATKRPPLHKVILLNDDFTPRFFVVAVLGTVFRLSEDEAYGVMMTAHQKGACVVSVYPRDVAETKAKEAVDMAQREGHPLLFTTEPED